MGDEIDLKLSFKEVLEKANQFTGNDDRRIKFLCWSLYAANKEIIESQRPLLWANRVLAVATCVVAGATILTAVATILTVVFSKFFGC
jgi:hypothetical protein